MCGVSAVARFAKCCFVCILSSIKTGDENDLEAKPVRRKVHDTHVKGPDCAAVTTQKYITTGTTVVPFKGKTLPTIGWHTSREGVCVVDVGSL